MNILIVLVILVGGAVCDREILSDVVARHGSSVPVKLNKNGQASAFPVQQGHLTPVGQQEKSYPGTAMRYLHQGLLSAVRAPPAETSIRATHDACSVTPAEAIMAGVFANTRNVTWQNELSWLPTTVPTADRRADYTMGTSENCSTYNDALKASQNSKAYIHGTRKYSKLMSLSVYTANAALARLEVGSLQNEIVSHPDKASRAKDNDIYIKLMDFTGRDNTIVNVRNSLGLYDGRVPEPTAAVLFELDVDTDGTGIFVVPHNASDDVPEMYDMNIENSAAPCYIMQDSRNVYRPILSGYWHEECSVAIENFNCNPLPLIIMYGALIYEYTPHLILEKSMA